MKISKKRTIESPLSMAIPKDYSLEKQGITQSLISLFLTCKQKFVYALNRMSSVTKIERTLFGNIVHDVLAELYSIGPLPKPRQVTDAVSAYKTANVKDINKLDPKKVERDFAVAEVMLKFYIDYYKNDWKEMLKREPEKELCVKLDTTVCRCKIDGRYRDKKGNKWLLETKTKGRISEDSLVKRLSFDPQCLYYIMCDSLDSKQDAHGILYNVVRNPQIKQKENENLQDFLDRLMEDVKKRSDFYLLRFELPFTKEDRKRFDIQVKDIIYEVDRFLTGLSPVIRNTYACDLGFTCEFLNACSSNSFAGYFKTEKIFNELSETEY